LPDGLKENDKLPHPVITPTTKAKEGHDEDISGADIVARGIVPAADYRKLEEFALALFERGTRLAAHKGLILVDTKYEFGQMGNRIYLIDEVHTPDSSRYFYSEGYAENQAAGRAQKHLSKEFVREWLISHGFQGLEGQSVPEMDDNRVKIISDRYIELYEQVTGERFLKTDSADIEKRIETSILACMNGL
jgi:phosphoribosylaminoimidazole-succinocarboxamide synthase